MDNSEIGNGHKSPMTLGEITRAEETELTSEISPIAIKTACMEFAIEITNGKGYGPHDVLEFAQTLFAWIMNDDD